MNDALVETLSSFAASALLPIAAGRGLVDRSWRLSLSERLVLYDESRFGAPEKGKPRFWFHGASVGEVSGLAPIFSVLSTSAPKGEVFVSTTSLTGQQIVREKGWAEDSFLLPFDHPRCVRRLLKSLNPSLLVIAETEIWPNLLFGASRAQVPILLINARISDYSFPRYRRLRAFLAPALNKVSFVLAQTAVDKQRFAEIGFPDERISISGSTKYDQEMPALNEGARAEFLSSLGIEADAPLFVAGSVRPGEDRQVISAYCRVRESVSGLQMLIAPRHPERFEEVAKLLAECGLSFNRRSGGRPGKKAPVVLLDTLGELTRAYAIASVCFVGGTLVDIGGHNPLEPAAYSSPVIVGPHTGNYREAVEALRKSGGVLEVGSGDELASSLLGLLCDESRRLSVGKAAFGVWQQNRGATQKVLRAIEQLLKTSS